VRRWKQGEEKGTVVADENDSGNHLNQLSSPTFLIINTNDSVYVSDSENHHVMKWMLDG
jgi:hypothetical protein